MRRMRRFRLWRHPRYCIRAPRGTNSKQRQLAIRCRGVALAPVYQSVERKSILKASASPFLVECAAEDADEFMPIGTVMWNDTGSEVLISVSPRARCTLLVALLPFSPPRTVPLHSGSGAEHDDYLRIFLIDALQFFRGRWIALGLGRRRRCCPLRWMGTLPGCTPSLRLTSWNACPLLGGVGNCIRPVAWRLAVANWSV